MPLHLLPSREYGGILLTNLTTLYQHPMLLRVGIRLQPKFPQV